MIESFLRGLGINMVRLFIAAVGVGGFFVGSETLMAGALVAFPLWELAWRE